MVPFFGTPSVKEISKVTHDIFKFSSGATIYWLVGYSFAFGGDGDGYKGNGDAFIGHDNFALSDFDENRYAFWFFQLYLPPLLPPLLAEQSLRGLSSLLILFTLH